MMQVSRNTRNTAKHVYLTWCNCRTRQLDWRPSGSYLGFNWRRPLVAASRCQSPPLPRRCSVGGPMAPARVGGAWGHSRSCAGDEHVAAEPMVAHGSGGSAAAAAPGCRGTGAPAKCFLHAGLSSFSACRRQPCASDSLGPNARCLPQPKHFPASIFSLTCSGVRWDAREATRRTAACASAAVVAAALLTHSVEHLAHFVAQRGDVGDGGSSVCSVGLESFDIIEA